MKFSIDENMEIIENEFKNACDFIRLDILIDGVKCSILSLEGQVDKQYMAIAVINPLLNCSLSSIKSDERINFVSENILIAADRAVANSMDEVIYQLMIGNAVMLVDGANQAVGFGVQGFKTRGVSEPTSENNLRGSKEGFVEPLIINMSMVRRRLRTTELKFERLYVGKQSKTPILLTYLENRVSREILNRIKLEVKEIDLKTVMAAGYLTGYLNKGGIFSTVGITERPDVVCAKIEEGRVAIIVDGTPTVLIMPYLFTENFQCLDDYADRPTYASYVRYVKYLCFIISLFLPAFYVGIIVSRPELIPR